MRWRRFDDKIICFKGSDVLQYGFGLDIPDGCFLLKILQCIMFKSL